MRQYRDLAHGRIARDRLQQALQGIAGIGRALAVVAVGQYAAARGPGEQDRYHGGISVMHDLRETEDRIIEAVVEAVDKDQHLPLRDGPQGAMEPCERPVTVDHVGLEGHKLRRRVARHLPRPLHLANLPGACGWDRNRNIGKGGGRSPVTGEHLLRINLLARGGDQHVDLTRPDNRCAHGHQHAGDGRTGAESRDEG
jgi:hypothetical protein